MKFVTTVTVLLTTCLTALVCPARAEESKNQSGLAQTLETYNKAWHEPDAEARTKILEQVWSKDGKYKDPSVSLQGIEALSNHIGGFIKQNPGARVFPTTRIDSYGTAFRAAWLLVYADGKPFEGFDAGEVDSEGKIASITGFFGALPNEEIKANEAVVADYLESLFKKYDLAHLDTIITKDAVYNQAEGLPYGGTYHGLPEMITMFTKAQTYFAMQVIDKPTYYTNPTTKKVFANFTIKCGTKKTDRHLTMAIMECFELKDGKIVGITPFYFDTKTFVEFLNEETKKTP